MATTTKVQNVVAVTDSKEAGAVCWWRLSGVIEQERLATVWEEQGLDKELLPAEPSPADALRRSMRHFNKGRQLVRPLGHGQGFAVVQEVIDDELNLTHAVLLNARLVTVDEHERLLFQPGPGVQLNKKLADEIRALYDHALATHSVDDISDWMANTLLPSVHAVGLRDKGGIYFVPRTTIDTWRRMVTAVRECSGHNVFEMPALSSAEAVSAILDAITREAEEAAAKMESELIEDDLGVRALKSRVTKLDGVLNKVTKYEQLLGTNLDVLRARMEQLSAQIAAAIFTAEAQADQEDE